MTELSRALSIAARSGKLQKKVMVLKVEQEKCKLKKSGGGKKAILIRQVLVMNAKLVKNFT